MHSLGESVREFYDAAGAEFSRTRRRVWSELLPYLNRIRPIDTVLDIGCGNGRLLNELKSYRDYVGVDFSEVLIQEAKKLHPKSTFFQGDITSEKTWNKLPSADAIFCVAVIHHMTEDQIQFLEKMIDKKLKTGGFAYVSVWNLWQKKYRKYHFSLASLWAKLRFFNWRVVVIPFGHKKQRLVLAYGLKSIRFKELVLDDAFLAGGDDYATARNLVWILKKP